MRDPSHAENDNTFGSGGSRGTEGGVSGSNRRSEAKASHQRKREAIALKNNVKVWTTLRHHYTALILLLLLSVRKFFSK